MHKLSIEEQTTSCKALLKIFKHFGITKLSFVAQPIMVVDNGNESHTMELWAVGDNIAKSCNTTAILVVAKQRSFFVKDMPLTQLCIMSDNTNYVTCNVEDIEKFIDIAIKHNICVVGQDFSTQFIPNMYKLIDAISYALANGYDLLLAHRIDLHAFATIAKAGQSLEEAAINIELAL